MTEKKQCCYLCSLRIGTLILLWVVMIGSGFHMWYLNLNQRQPESLSNPESITNAKNSAASVGKSDKIIRQKRSAEFLDRILKAPEKVLSIVSNTFNDITNVTAQIAKNSISTFNNISSNIINSAGNLGIELHQNGQNFTDNVSKLPNDDVVNSIVSSVSNIAINVTELTDPIINHVIDHVEDSGIINKVTKQVSEDIIGDINNRVDKRLNALEYRFQLFFTNFIHFFIRIWGMLGISSSALGIYGIHRDIPKCLTFGVFFFHFSIVSQFLIMSEINIDSSIERKTFLVSELVGIEWRSFLESSMILVNLGISCLIALSLYCSLVVKRCQSSMLKKDVINRFDLNKNLIQNTTTMDKPPAYF